MTIAWKENVLSLYNAVNGTDYTDGEDLSKEEAIEKAVDKLAADGTISAEKACELLEVSLEDYLKWKAERKA
ncbi:MAG: hypothetical protein E7219_03620 [Clostridiales bacterium]|jgi:predicted HTH domain antitoxin|nr:hypothetical protein [Clostridiales bacterium]